MKTIFWIIIICIAALFFYLWFSDINTNINFQINWRSVIRIGGIFIGGFIVGFLFLAWLFKR